MSDSGVTVTGMGRKSGVKRAIQLQVQQIPAANNVFNYGIASASEISFRARLLVTYLRMKSFMP